MSIQCLLSVLEENNVAVYACRYDVALDVNVMGVKHMCQLAKKCPNLEVILHVSTGKSVFTTLSI